jgi:aspartyl/asparaginyl-tRNA synthetase
MVQSPSRERIVTQIVKKFHAFYGTQRFITVFTPIITP